MSNYIYQVKIPGTDHQKPIILANPIGMEMSAINVFCGENCSGKSFILRQIRNVVSRMKVVASEYIDKCQFGVSLINSSDEKPYVVLFSDSWIHKREVGMISINNTKFSKIEYNPNDKLNLLKLFYTQFKKQLLVKGKELDEWLALEDRYYTIQELSTELIYPFDSEDPVISCIEQIMEVNLFYKVNDSKGIEIVLVDNNNNTMPYANWSDGQQVTFYIILNVLYEKPDIIIIDELENHLHPKYITKLLSFIKQQKCQVIISSHHPHIIFSHYIDKAFYIDLVGSKRVIKSNHPIPLRKITNGSEPERIIRSLENDMEKMEALYKLFDKADLQLLKQANHIFNEADIIFYKALSKIFCCDVFETRNGLIPDRQSQDLANFISCNSHSERKNIQILDLGTGLGRLEGELEKVSKWKLKKNIIWFCWEYSSDTRNKLMIKFQGKTNLNILKSIDDVEDLSCDIVTIVNVLHEVTAEVATDIIYDASQKMNLDYGVLIIMEIFPLLSAEKFAIAYSNTHIQSILNSSGFTCSFTNFPVRDATAYCIVARKRSNDIDKKVLYDNVKKTWFDIEKESTSSYSNRNAFSNYSDYRNTIQDMTTLASISAWRHGIWK